MNASKYLTGSGLVRSGPGVLRSVLLTAGSDLATITIYNNTVGSGDVLTILKVAANTSVSWSVPGGIVASKGIYGELTGTSPGAIIVY